MPPMEQLNTARLLAMSSKSQLNYVQQSESRFSSHASCSFMISVSWNTMTSHKLPERSSSDYPLRGRTILDIRYCLSLRGLVLPLIAHVGMQIDPLELWLFLVFENDISTGESERGNRPVLQGCASVRKVDSAPGSCGTDMGLLLASLGSICLHKGKTCGVQDSIFWKAQTLPWA